MYKNFKITKNLSIAVETFKKKHIKLSKVYTTGFHRWRDDLNGLTFYSVVIGCSRIIVVKENNNIDQCQCPN